jgi:hypothetical protein
VVRKRPEAKQAHHGWTSRPPQSTRVTSEGSQKAVKRRNAMFDFVGSHAAHWPRTSSAYYPESASATMRQVDLVAGGCEYIEMNYESEVSDII